MLTTRIQILAGAWFVGLLAVPASLQATLMYGPSKALVLPAGQLIESGSLNAAVARPDTLLGEFDPTYHTLLASNDDTAGVGDGHGSELLGVPLLPNGAAFFRVTGHGDVNFNGSHTQSGSYEVDFIVYDLHHNVISTSSEIEDVQPGMVDNVWVSPSAAAIGGSVDVIVNNLPYPVTGNPMSFYEFTGLHPNQSFTAQIDASTFPSLVGWFQQSNSIYNLAQSGPNSLTGTADGAGKVVIGITGQPDTQFVGAHTDVGSFTVQIVPTPEPAGVVLIGLGGAVASLGGYVRRRKRRLAGPAADTTPQ
ncbi:MAG TPA: PEP-CTERM sorting domain-containing protein [Pirellulales bacterium]|nr:PEP-CTERM sorting domain-containing protein [Pirellulales bacterium]